MVLFMWLVASCLLITMLIFLMFIVIIDTDAPMYIHTCVFVKEFAVFDFYVCLGCYSCLLDVRLGLSRKFEIFVGHLLFSHSFYSRL